MQLKEMLLKEKISQQLWQVLALKVKNSHWQAVRAWLETKTDKYPTAYKEDLLWLLQTLK